MQNRNPFPRLIIGLAANGLQELLAKYGIFWLKEFWAVFVFSIALLWSVRRDWMVMKGGRPEREVA